MSTKLAKQEIERFLASAEPEVLCIRGKWGTGKTYNWKTVAKAAKMKPGGVALNTYCYVSLFGVSSLADIKMQIVQATVPRKAIGEPDATNRWLALYDTMESAAKKAAMKAVSFLGKSQFEAAMAAMAATISRQIICIDDLERKGAGLSTADVLGLISHFREENSAKSSSCSMTRFWKATKRRRSPAISRRSSM
jgi:Cdc6-like AAA superfamily ATPase